MGKKVSQMSLSDEKKNKTGAWTGRFVIFQLKSLRMKGEMKEFGEAKQREVRKGGPEGYGLD